MSNPVVYIGPSWAARSYDTHAGDESDTTNLIKELELDKNVVNLSKLGASNFENIGRLKNSGIKPSKIIWVYSEPLNDINLGLSPNMEEFLKSEDCFIIRQDLSNLIIRNIAQNFDCPIALIGAHSDVPLKVEYDNITVIHPSWQKFLANYVNVELNEGWGTEVPQRELVIKYKHVMPSKTLVNKMTYTYSAWIQMEFAKVFCWCHPNRSGNELFAKEIKENLFNWLETK